MKVFTIYNTKSTLNTYLIGSKKGTDAIIIDPGNIDLHLLDLADNNNYYIKHIFVTHAHDRHTQGIKTLMKIFDAEIYGMCPFICDFKTNILSGKTKIEISGINIEIIEASGHSEDSIVYKIDNIYFTGDVLSAGRIGSSLNSNLKKTLQDNIREKILSTFEDCIIMPGHGPPTTVMAEKSFNPYINSY